MFGFPFTWWGNTVGSGDFSVALPLTFDQWRQDMMTKWAMMTSGRGGGGGYRGAIPTQTIPTNYLPLLAELNSALFSGGTEGGDTRKPNYYYYSINDDNKEG